MDFTMFAGVSCAFSWLIVALSAMGHFVTLKRTGEKWALWVLLGVGWGFNAVPSTLLFMGASVSRRQYLGMWLSSYVLVAGSLLLLFLKLVDILKQKRAAANEGLSGERSL